MKINLGERIRFVRKKAGFTQKQLAENLKIAFSTLNMYEKGHRIPDAEILRQITIITKFPDPGWLLTGEPSGKVAPLYSTEDQHLIDDLIKILHGKNKDNAEAIIWNVKAFAKTADIDTTEREKEATTSKKKTSGSISQ